MREAIEYLAKEWGRIAQAPAVFTVAVILVAGMVWVALKWRYEGIIEHLRERLSMKDQQLDEYRERLSLSPAKGSAYSKLTHKELRDEAVRLSNEMRRHVEPKARMYSDADSARFARMANETDAVKRASLWEESMRESAASSSELMTDYDRMFKANAIVIRDELLSRLPTRPSSRPIDADRRYERPTNLLGIRAVADDLNLLAAHIG